MELRGSKITGRIKKERKKKNKNKKRAKLKHNPIWPEFAPPFRSNRKIRDEERQVVVAVTAPEPKVSGGGRQGGRECVCVAPESGEGSQRSPAVRYVFRQLVQK